MACNLTIGRAVPCKDVVGGIKAVYFLNYGATATYDSTNTDVIDDLGTITAFKYELKGGSSFEQAINSSRENGTTFFEQTLNLSFAIHDTGVTSAAVPVKKHPIKFDNSSGLIFLS
jgi:hypothetical protein